MDRRGELPRGPHGSGVPITLHRRGSWSSTGESRGSSPCQGSPPVSAPMPVQLHPETVVLDRWSDKSESGGPARAETGVPRRGLCGSGSRLAPPRAACTGSSGTLPDAVVPWFSFGWLERDAADHTGTTATGVGDGDIRPTSSSCETFVAVHETTAPVHL